MKSFADKVKNSVSINLMKVNGMITLMNDDVYVKLNYRTVNRCVPNLMVKLSLRVFCWSISKQKSSVVSRLQSRREHKFAKHKELPYIFTYACICVELSLEGYSKTREVHLPLYRKTSWLDIKQKLNYHYLLFYFF